MAIIGKHKKNKSTPNAEENVALFDRLNFAGTEAYNLLRTNLLFTLPDASKKCNVVGVTSSMRGEGKSTTSINLSFALAATEKKVLLIDGDLRLPTVAKKLGISVDRGLSDVLLEPQYLEDAIYTVEGHENFHVLTSGKLPPNPSEMLASSQMANLIEKLSQSYDFIIVDFPPVNIVSDALIAAPLLDGVIVVVRRNFSTLREVNRCEKQLALSGVKVLGFVFTHADGGHGKYKYRKYRKYKRYYYEKDGYAKEPDMQDD